MNKKEVYAVILLTALVLALGLASKVMADPTDTTVDTTTVLEENLDALNEDVYIDDVPDPCHPSNPFPPWWCK